MSSEAAPIVWVTRESAVLRTISGSLTIPYNEPASFSLVLDNSAGTYGPSSAIAQVRDTPVYLNLRVQTDINTWVSPDLIVEEYEYNTQEVTVKGRCRLSQLDRDDQAIDVSDGVSTVEGDTVSDILSTVATEYGLTITGAPSRTVERYNLVGNPPQWFDELLPDYVFRMGTGGQIVISSATSHTAGPSLEDAEDLEVLRFVRSSDLYNKVTVERLVEQSGEITLLSVQQSWDTHPSPSILEYTLDEPSRLFMFRVLKGYRGYLNSIVLKDENGDPVGPSPFMLTSYVGTTPVHSFSVVYELGTGAAGLGPFKSNLEILVTGYPLDVSPPPVESYSVTLTDGAGDRPYPEPFSSVAIPDETAATAVATALLEEGLRIGNILDVSTRLRADMIPTPNQYVSITDEDTGFEDLEAIVEAVTISWAEGGDTGTMSLSCTFVEES